MTVFSLSCFGKVRVPGLGFGGFLFFSFGVGLSDAVGGFRVIFGTGVLAGVLLWSLFGVFGGLFVFVVSCACSWLGFVFVLTLVSCSGGSLRFLFGGVSFGLSGGFLCLFGVVLVYFVSGVFG